MAKTSASILSSIKRTSLARFMVTAVILACCVALTWGLSACASGSESSTGNSSEGEFAVALTIVDEVDGDVVYNAAVDGMTSNDTVVDMLEAAGFKKVTTLEETADDPHAFTLSNDSPYFMGKGWDAQTSDYWITMFNGSSDNWQSAMAGSKLQKDGHYQYIYDTQDTMTFEYTASIPDPLEGDSADSSEAQAA